MKLQVVDLQTFGEIGRCLQGNRQNMDTITCHDLNIHEMLSSRKESTACML